MSPNTSLEKTLSDEHLYNTVHQQRNSIHLIPVVRELYAVIKALCGLLAACTVLPAASVVKWLNNDQTPVFKRGIYGTFFSQKTHTGQDFDALKTEFSQSSAKWDGYMSMGQ